MSVWNAEPATLYVIATPIGNLDDLSARAGSILQSVDWVASEDTRQTRKLMTHLGSSVRLRSLHRGNEARGAPALIKSLQAGASGALVSDAGTPLISDPGRWLVDAALDADITVTPLPGPCAAVAALSVAGLEATPFVFEGFLPARAPARRSRLQELKAETRTWLVYEAPHRIQALMGDLHELLEADRYVIWARELTKRHEEVGRIRAGDLSPETFMARGEYVVVVQGAETKPEVPTQTLEIFLKPLLEAGFGVAQTASLARQCLGVTRKEAYARALELHDTLGRTTK